MRPVRVFCAAVVSLGLLASDGQAQTVASVLVVANTNSAPSIDIAEYYVKRLRTTYAQRLAKGFSPEDFEAIFQADQSLDLFGRDLSQIKPIWSVERELTAL